MNVKLIFLIMTFITVLVSTTAFAGQNQRYIVIGNDLPGLKQGVTNQGGSVIHDLSYHNGFVAHMAETAANNLAQIFGSATLIEKDIVVSASKKPSWAGGGGDEPPAQPLQETPWGIFTVLAPDAWSSVSYGTRGAGVLVCIVDTGIQKNHPDLPTNISGENFVGKGPLGKKINPDAWGDDHSHGSHVAGTIAALDNDIGVVGVAPEADLFAAKVLNKDGSGYASAVADGILSCVTNGADVINMSLGSSTSSSTIQSAVQTAFNAGVILVAAAGNSGDSGDPNGNISYPAKYPEVYAVSAIDSDLNLAYFSSRGPEVDFAAPGYAVYSTSNNSDYDTKSGTSMASPHMAGVAALMLSSNSLGFVADDIGLASFEQGNGLINALATVENQ